ARQQPQSTLFPYTTLFRSHVLNEKLNSLLAPHKEGAKTAAKEMVQEVVRKTVVPTPEVPIKERPTPETPPIPELSKAESARVARSEEHTSELQSRENLVCR